MISLLTFYFNKLPLWQKEKFQKLIDLYKYWNKQINVISRKDIDNLVERHLLPSLAIAKFMPFVKDDSVLDAGTGGGLPGIPLAIFFPEVSFQLVDSTEKKIKVVQEIVKALNLSNVQALHARIEAKGKEKEDPFGNHDFVLSRGVGPLADWVPLLAGKLRNPPKEKGVLRSGLLFLKGGDLSAEIASIDHQVNKYAFDHQVNKYALSKYFTESFFTEKYLLHIHIKHK